MASINDLVAAFVFSQAHQIWMQLSWLVDWSQAILYNMHEEQHSALASCACYRRKLWPCMLLRLCCHLSPGGKLKAVRSLRWRLRSPAS